MWAKLQSDVGALAAAAGPELLYNLWAAAGVVLFLTWFLWSYGFIRRKCGHVKFRGTWYNERQFLELIEMIDEDCRKGNRVMQHDEMRLLRMHRFGDDKTYAVKGWGYK